MTLSKSDPRDTSGLDVSAFLKPEHRAYLDLLGPKFAAFAGFTMKDPDEDDEDDEDEDDPLELDPEDRVKVGDKVMTVKDLTRIAAREKRQGKRAGQKSVLEQLGYDTIDDALAALAKVPKTDKPKTGDKPDDEEARRAQQREEDDRRDRAKQRRKERSLDLRGALRDAGVPRADLDDAEAVFDRYVDKEYDADDLDEALDRFQESRAGKAFFDEDDDAASDKPKPRAATMPKGRPKSKNKPPAKPFGAAGRARAERKGWIKADS